MSQSDTLQQLADRIAIREVMDEYCLRLEIDSFADWLDLFTPDATYEVFRRELKGHQAITDMLSQAPHGVHIGGALRIELDGDRAETVQNYAFFGDDDSFSNNGWYYRTLVRTPAGWKISAMRVKMQKQTNRPLRPDNAASG